ncbi:MAG: type II toxin-antitoxin system RelE/ParE family toxin [Methyloceanibacter sp.]
MAIQTFRHKGLKRFFENDDARTIQAKFVDKLRDMLAAIDSAMSVDEVGLLPGWRLHRLKGDFPIIGVLPLAAIGVLFFASRKAMLTISISWTTIEKAQRCQ